MLRSCMNEVLLKNLVDMIRLVSFFKRVDFVVTYEKNGAKKEVTTEKNGGQTVEKMESATENNGVLLLLLTQKIDFL